MVKTIRISDETHEELYNFGKKGETYEKILMRLLRIARSKQERYNREYELEQQEEEEERRFI